MLWTPENFHIELTDICSAQCPFCLRSKSWVTLWNNQLFIEDITKFFDDYVLKNLTSVYLCWNLWDPIYAKDFLLIVEFFVSHNIDVTISTNGFNNKKLFWEKLGSMWVTVVFWIDGISQKTHSSYRVWTDLKQVLKNAKNFIDAWGIWVWQLIVFKNNEHQIDIARKTAKKMWFSDFLLKTSREYSQNLPQPKYKIPKQWGSITSTFECKYRKNKRFYISSSWYILPCCFLWDAQFSNTLLQDKKMNIKGFSFEDIQKNAVWEKEIWNFHYWNWTNACSLNCWKTQIRPKEYIKL